MQCADGWSVGDAETDADAVRCRAKAEGNGKKKTMGEWD